MDETIAVEIEAERMANRLAELEAARIRARSELRRWIGEAADQELDAAAPAFAIDPAQMRERLRRHPALGAYRAEIDAAEAGPAMARAERRPDWSWELSYGRRDPSFGDMASIEVRVGLRRFQPWRQGPLVAARRADVARAEADRTAAEREYAAALDSQLAEYSALSANLERARSLRLPLATQRANAAAGAFAAGRANAVQLIDARFTNQMVLAALKPITGLTLYESLDHHSGLKRQQNRSSLPDCLRTAGAAPHGANGNHSG